MATVYPKFKDGKIISFKFKTYLGRDENGKQIFKCTTWIPEPENVMTELRMRKRAEIEAALWESQIIKEYIKEESIPIQNNITVEEFINIEWFPFLVSKTDYRETTIEFHKYLLKVIIPYLGKYQLRNVTDKTIEKYLDYLRFTYKTKNNKSLAPKTIRHHYNTLNLIFEYAVKLGYAESNPLENVDTPKLSRHKVDALSKSEAVKFLSEIQKLPLMHQAIYTLFLTTGIRRGECFEFKIQSK